MTDVALAKFMAGLEAQSAAILAQRERERADARLNDLADYIAVFAGPAPRDGMAGAGDVFFGLMSARHWRNLRAKSLYAARRQQLMGRSRDAAFWLRKAAEQRITEKQYRAAERRAQIMPIIFDACSGVLPVAAE